MQISFTAKQKENPSDHDPSLPDGNEFELGDRCGFAWPNLRIDLQIYSAKGYSNASCYSVNHSDAFASEDIGYAQAIHSSSGGSTSGIFSEQGLLGASFHEAFFATGNEYGETESSRHQQPPRKLQKADRYPLATSSPG